LQGFYDFLFSLDYLKPIYELKLDKKILDELSPGEKGTLLLVFYLMIDREDIPLVIDQPEDNLDNKSVFQVLTRFIKSAKKRRQIIIVTHNPNLAVGADAEQIIYVELDKRGGKNKFKHEVGSIEDPTINARLVEILEGTMPAFDKRKLRYRKES
jgi:ABC-type cobalamin/Fe3+-siderophores transport system ATPase subunit